MIYFVQRSDDAVKIGYTTNRNQRFTALAIEHGPLLVLGVVKGSMRQERALHRKLADYRIEGEWFSPTEEVLNAVDEDLPEQTGFKTITVEVENEVHAKLVDMAKSDDRPLIKFLARQLAKLAGKATK